MDGSVDEDTSAAMLVRVWLEDGTGDFRARLTRLRTIAGRNVDEGLTVAVASSPDAVCAAIRAWLDEFLDAFGDRD